jgi:hypothetical protein
MRPTFVSGSAKRALPTLFDPSKEILHLNDVARAAMGNDI